MAAPEKDDFHHILLVTDLGGALKFMLRVEAELASSSKDAVMPSTVLTHQCSSLCVWNVTAAFKKQA